MEVARAERFLNSRAKNPADALCTERGKYMPRKRGGKERRERASERNGEEGTREER